MEEGRLSLHDPYNTSGPLVNFVHVTGKILNTKKLGAGKKNVLIMSLYVPLKNKSVHTRGSCMRHNVLSCPESWIWNEYEISNTPPTVKHDSKNTWIENQYLWIVCNKIKEYNYSNKDHWCVLLTIHYSEILVFQNLPTTYFHSACLGLPLRKNRWVWHHLNYSHSIIFQFFNPNHFHLIYFCPPGVFLWTSLS